MRPSYLNSVGNNFGSRTFSFAYTSRIKNVTRRVACDFPGKQRLGRETTPAGRIVGSLFLYIILNGLIAWHDVILPRTHLMSRHLEGNELMLLLWILLQRIRQLDTVDSSFRSGEPKHSLHCVEYTITYIALNLHEPTFCWTDNSFHCVEPTIVYIVLNLQ